MVKCNPETSSVSSSACRANTLFHETNCNFGKFNYNSLNFEHLLLCNPANSLGVRIGGIYYTFPKISSWGITAGFSMIFGRYSNLFEIGLGATYMKVYKNYEESIGKYKDYASFTGMNAVAGFRHQDADGGLFYRLGFTPMISIAVNKDIPIIEGRALIPMAGLSIGWTFR